MDFHDFFRMSVPEKICALQLKAMELGFTAVTVVRSPGPGMRAVLLVSDDLGHGEIIFSEKGLAESPAYFRSLLKTLDELAAVSALAHLKREIERRFVEIIRQVDCMLEHAMPSCFLSTARGPFAQLDAGFSKLFGAPPGLLFERMTGSIGSSAYDQVKLDGIAFIPEVLVPLKVPDLTLPPRASKIEMPEPPEPKPTDPEPTEAEGPAEISDIAFLVEHLTDRSSSGDVAAMLLGNGVDVEVVASAFREVFDGGSDA